MWGAAAAALRELCNVLTHPVLVKPEPGSFTFNADNSVSVLNDDGTETRYASVQEAALLRRATPVVFDYHEPNDTVELERLLKEMRCGPVTILPDPTTPWNDIADYLDHCAGLINFAEYQYGTPGEIAEMLRFRAASMRKQQALPLEMTYNGLTDGCAIEMSGILTAIGTARQSAPPLMKFADLMRVPRTDEEVMEADALYPIGTPFHDEAGKVIGQVLDSRESGGKVYVTVKHTTPLTSAEKVTIEPLIEDMTDHRLVVMESHKLACAEP
jgi:hypothetical protein